MSPQLVWLKRDLRIHDHGPLATALAHGPVLACYVFEPSLWARPEMDPSHFIFICQSLEDLDAAFRSRGNRICVRVGEIPEVFERIHQEVPFSSIHAHEETGLNLTYARDRRVHRWCRDRGISFQEYPHFGVFRPHPSRDGWARRWESRMRGSPSPTPERIPFAKLPETFDWGRIPKPADLQLSKSEKTEAQPGGSVEGEVLLRSFLDTRGENYRKDMSSPVTAWRGCSRLSAHLAFGTVSMRQVYQATVRRHGQVRRRRMDDWAASLEAFEGRLRWHGHFIQKLEDEPELEFRNIHRGYDNLRTEDPKSWSAQERSRFDAWRLGRTGFPMVDAAMRCLHRTGWVNFRMRAMLASFACHHLWLHWRAPAVALAPHFLDFEPGIHFSQFQMQAGTTGMNTIRIYNVAKQALDHDPQGIFIRKYLPELERVPLEYLAEPHRMPGDVQRASGCRVGRDYPPPIIDHGQAVRFAKSRLEAVKRRFAHQAETARVVLAHGSRRRPGRPRGRTSGGRTLV